MISRSLHHRGLRRSFSSRLLLRIYPHKGGHRIAGHHGYPASAKSWKSLFPPSSGLSQPAPLSLSFPKPLGIIPITHTHTHRSTHTLDSPSSSPSSTSPSAEPLTPYTPPTTGLLSHLPRSWVPYAELVRLDKPTGTYYLFLPCLFSTLLAAPLAAPPTPTPPLAVLSTAALFLAGAFVMRGAGCAINDLWDRDLDPRVRRTRHRPVARGAVSPARGLALAGAGLAAGLAVLLRLPPACLLYGAPSLLLVAAYPLAKRVTHYPQLVLGLTFSWGALMGWPALGVDFLGLGAAAPSVLGEGAASFLGLGLGPGVGVGVGVGAATAAAASSPAAVSSGSALAAAACLYLSNVSWTVLYDMIYAHMDIRDDAKAGIKSIALAHAGRTKPVLALLAAAQVGLLAGAGWAAGSGPAFFAGSCGGAALTLGWMIRRVKLESVRDCWWWFVNGCWITGGVIAAGLGADYLLRYSEAKKRLEKGDGSGDDDDDDDDDGSGSSKME